MIKPLAWSGTGGITMTAVLANVITGLLALTGSLATLFLWGASSGP